MIHNPNFHLFPAPQLTQITTRWIFKTSYKTTNHKDLTYAMFSINATYNVLRRTVSYAKFVTTNTKIKQKLEGYAVNAN